LWSLSLRPRSSESLRHSPPSARAPCRIAAGAKRGLRAVLVACEVALSVVLVAGSALLIESLIRLEAVDPGFDPQRAVVFNVVLPRVRYPKDADARQGVERIEASLKSIPGAQSVGAVLMPPLRGAGWTADVTPEGRPDGDYERELRFNCASPGFLEAASIRLLRGRNFNEFDKADTDPVFLVNETLEKVYFRGQSAVGKRIKLGRPYDEAKWALVVGVVADTKQDGMDARVRPMAYYPFSQQPSRSMWLVVRGAGIGDSMIRQAVASVDPGVAINDFEPMDRLIADSTQKHRFRASLLGGFAGIALFLATLGIYGVLAYWVSQRATEIGVRLALGAPLPRLFRMVVSEGMRPVLAGALVGLLGAAAAAKAFQTLLFGVAAINPLSYLLTAGIMVAVALAACALPALRAIRVDPLISLRGQ
jgi:putative ABC transport system permease protein